MATKTKDLLATDNIRAKKQSGPRDDRRAELLRQAMECLASRGYAHTTLRDIASESGMSLGRLYYYFESKEELIAKVVTHYKEEFLVGILASFEGAESVDAMLERVIAEFVRTIRTSAKTHRLWYDMRTQALFDDKFREVVDPIQAGLRTFFPALMKQIGKQAGIDMAKAVDTEMLYLMTDALFFRALQDDVTDNRKACLRFRKSLRLLFDTTIVSAVRVAQAKTDAPSSRRKPVTATAR